MRGRLPGADVLPLVEATALGSDDERVERLPAELRDALPLKVGLGGEARTVESAKCAHDVNKLQPGRELLPSWVTAEEVQVQRLVEGGEFVETPGLAICQLVS